MRVLAVLSLKGGVGKTTTVLGLAGAAARRDLSTLVVDLDPQSNASTALEAGPSETTIAEALEHPVPARLTSSVARSAWSERVEVLVGSEDVERHNHPDPGSRRLGRLATLLGRLEGSPAEPDLVLVDCPPSLGQLTRSALVAAHRALLVTEPTIFAVAGVQRAFEAVQAEREHNPVLQPLGVLVNRVRARSTEHEFRLDELQELFGPLVLPHPVPDRSAVAQAQGAGLPVQRWDTPGAREVARVFDDLLDRVLRIPSPGS